MSNEPVVWLKVLELLIIRHKTMMQFEMIEEPGIPGAYGRDDHVFDGPAKGRRGQGNDTFGHVVTGKD